MNYLAHLVLSGSDPAVRMGNLMGDFCVGRLEHPRFQNLPPNIRLGLALHRWIDEQTDREESWDPLIDFLRPDFGKWAPAILDILGDYMIIHAWKQWNLGDFSAYECQVYADLESQFHFAPENMKPMLESLLTHRWLAGYGTWEGIDRAITSVSRRIKISFPRDSIRLVLLDEPERFAPLHQAFFQQMIIRSESFRSDNMNRFS